MSESSAAKKKLPIIQTDLARELGHGICVSNLSFRVARELGLPKERCQELAVAGFLHDVGKLGLKKYVYDHETLVVEELKYVRLHADIGVEILRKCGYSEEMVEWIHCHHENCDGSGYPRNLTREEIPLEARIIRVCDVFAALTSERSYRKAFDADTAVELMIEEAKNYDIKVFLAFLNVIHEEGAERLLEGEETERYLNTFLEEEETIQKEISL